MPLSKSTVEVQELFLTFLLSDPSLYVRVQNIYNADNFDKSLRAVATFLRDHVKDYSAIPTKEQVLAVTGKKIEILSNNEIQRGHTEWFLQEFEQFTKAMELERAILKSTDLLEKGDFGAIETLVKSAVQISLTRDLGIDYFHQPKARLQLLRDTNGQVSTGWKDLDGKLYGGFNRGELNIFCGSPGTGKSLFLQNIALNWVERGLSGVYISFELSAELTAMRIDTMLTGIQTKELFRQLDTVDYTVRTAAKKYGKLKIKYMPAQSTVYQIRAYLKELAIQEGFYPDFVLLDYLDLIMPGGTKVDVGDSFIKDKIVCEELRNMSMEEKFLMVTASQLNRSAYDTEEFTGSNIAGGISKMNTADFLAGIYTSRSMRERGIIQLQLMKTRNSSGVGSKVELGYNIESMRITDCEVTTEDDPVLNGSNVLEKIKNKGSFGEGTQDKKTLLTGLLSSIQKKGE